MAENYVCAVWGLRDELGHHDCPVIVNHPGEGVQGSPARTAKLPMVCKCECRECKRAWWDKGRPVLREGKIVYAPEGSVR